VNIQYGHEDTDLDCWCVQGTVLAREFPDVEDLPIGWCQYRFRICNAGSAGIPKEIKNEKGKEPQDKGWKQQAHNVEQYTAAASDGDERKPFTGNGERIVDVRGVQCEY
jgi:hypothetical protein